MRSGGSRSIYSTRRLLPPSSPGQHWLAPRSSLIGPADDLLGKAVTFIFVLVRAAPRLPAHGRGLHRSPQITYALVLLAMPMFPPRLLTGPYFAYADCPSGIVLMLAYPSF